MFSFNLLVIIWRGKGVSFDIGRPRSRGWKNFGCGWIRGVGGRGSRKLDNFDGCHMYIIPNRKSRCSIFL